jgi:hypothetical protein
LCLFYSHFFFSIASDEETRRHVAAALSHLSANQLGAAYIFRSGGIAELVRLLRCPIASVINYATTTLHHLLVYVEQAKQEAIACGALEAFVPLLAPQTVIPQSGPNPKLQAMVSLYSEKTESYINQGCGFAIFSSFGSTSMQKHFSFITGPSLFG